MKPVLAEAVAGYRYLLRFQAMECFCPLNGVRLLPNGTGGFRQCNRNQLDNPEICAKCVDTHGRFSGQLHKVERALAGVGTLKYHERLVNAVRQAEAVLVVNPLHAAILGPYSSRVKVVTSGMDSARFPWPWAETRSRARTTLFFAGLVDELMKGFDILHAACAALWQKRQDFELIATGDPPGQIDEFTRFVGWLSQNELPTQLRAADVVIVPTIAQEALGAQPWKQWVLAGR